MSYLDYIDRRDDEVCKGTYYSELPDTPDDSGVAFTYDIANYREISYINLLQNINVNGETETIKTNSLANISLKGYIALQGGGLWQIKAFTKKPVKDEYKQVLRVRRHSNAEVYIIRLIRIYDKWGINER